MWLINFLADLIREGIAIIVQESEVDESSRQKISRLIKTGFILLIMLSYILILYKSYAISKSFAQYKLEHPETVKECREKLHSDASSDSGTGLVIPDNWKIKTTVPTTEYRYREANYYDDTTQ